MSHVLVTGADGHLGRWMVQWLLDNTAFSLMLWVRATDTPSLEAKVHRLGAFLASGRCTVVGSDLTRDAPFADVDGSNVSHVIHSAADTAFGISREHALQVNVAGTRKLLDWAQRAPILEKFMLLSTIYSCGLRAGTVREEPLDESEKYANYYEWSKWAAERLLIDEYSHLPWQILRVGTVVADNDQGQVTQYNALHNTLRLVFYGLLSVVPGLPSTRLYMTTSDFSAAACGQLLLSCASKCIFHIADSGDSALRLENFLDTVYACFLEDERFRKTRILKPLLCDWSSFSTLLEGTGQFSGVLGQSMNSVAPFAPQLYVDRDINIERQRAALPELKPPVIAEILPRVCRQLIASRWGLKKQEMETT